MKKTLLASRDLGFLLYEWLDVLALCRRARFDAHDRGRFDAVLGQAAQLARDHLAPVNRALDEKEPRLTEEGVQLPPELYGVMRAMRQSGLLAMSHDQALGGLQLPVSIEKAAAAWFYAGNAAATAYLFPARAGSRLLQRHAGPGLAAAWLPKLLRGDATCTFCVSEPQAGSSLSDIRTRAVRQADGTFRLYGNKMWVVGGEHALTDNIVHLVLARIEHEDGSIDTGTDGLSLFLAPRFLPAGEDGGAALAATGESGCDAQGVQDAGPGGLDAAGLGRHAGQMSAAEGAGLAGAAAGGDASGRVHNDIAATGLYPQMGQRGATSCLLSFGEGYFRPGGQAGALAWLVGEENCGMRLVNEASPEIQIDVGMSAVALGYAGYLQALDYARERHQGRVPGMPVVGSAQIPIIGHADVRRTLLYQKAYVEGGLALGLWCARLMDEADTAETSTERARARDLLLLLAPVAKSWSAHNGLIANSLAIQVLGCYGYTRDYPVEQLYRDNRFNAIQERTHGILALELMRDYLLRDDFRGFQRFIHEVEQTLERASARVGDVRHMAVQLQKYAERFGWIINRIRQEPEVARQLANASIFIEALGHFAIGWVWLEQALVAEVAYLSAYGAERNFYAGKCQTARFFFQHDLPRIETQLALLEQMDLCTMEMQPGWF